MVTSDPELQAGLLSLVRVVVERGEVLQGGPVAELQSQYSAVDRRAQ